MDQLSAQGTHKGAARRDDIRNIAIIAHVDHGKTTLVDAMLRQSGVFRENQQVSERVLDRNELERERGITILAKNTAIVYHAHTINIVDTPGHADFSGEVERILSMVDGALLVVDAVEGPMPQTRYVLRKALEVGLRPIVFINKVDRPEADSPRALDGVIDLFIALGAGEDQLDFPVLYGSGRSGTSSLDWQQLGSDLRPLFETILSTVPAPETPDGDLQMMVSSLDYDDYLGRIALGRVHRGEIAVGQSVTGMHRDGSKTQGKVAKLFVYQGLERVPVESVRAGQIVAVSGLANIFVGETIAGGEEPKALPVLTVDEPTLTMTFRVNDSPFSGREGKFVTSRHLRDRLARELERNVALRVEDTDSPDAFVVAGRGELHLSILIETMRREGFELAVSRPEVILRGAGDAIQEPFEELLVDVPEAHIGAVMEGVGRRRGELLDMENVGGEGRRLRFRIPSRGLIGYRGEFLTATKGYGTMHHVFAGYGPVEPPPPGRSRGSLVASETGEATSYALDQLADRGAFFISPGTEVYHGMVVGEHTRERDLDLNVCKRKHVTNVRNATAEEAIRLQTPRTLSLEDSLEFLSNDELLEVTPQTLRIRKAVLDAEERKKIQKAKSKAEDASR
ncbi:MAG: translational GTPase TypA [Thermaerobacter sp.]|nr:translational GTPase TypA [Thermaerobacter sp.]